MLVLFDIDGTLLSTRRLGLECFRQAFEDLFQRPAVVESARMRLAGNLDPVIWRELCRANGVTDAEADEHHARFRAVYARALAQRLAAEPGRSRAFPGVAALLDALEAGGRVTLGLLTGNYPETAELKIAAAGLGPERFVVGSYGCDGAARADLVPVALLRHAERTGASLAATDVVVIGDTPRDVECGRAHGARTLAVATGPYCRAELEAAGADRTVPSLVDTQSIHDWILGG